MEDINQELYSSWQEAVRKAINDDDPTLQPDSVPIEELRVLSEGKKKAEEQAMTDPLTKLHNRRWLEENGLTWDPKTTAAIFIDLDQFGEVNNTWGHEAGDRVLQVIAERLNGVKSKHDEIVRYGGEEFVILLKDFKEQGIAGIKKRMHGLFEDPVSYNSTSVPVGASCGLALGEELSRSNQKMTIMDLVNASDKAMYEVKGDRKQKGSFTGLGFQKYNPHIQHSPANRPVTPIG